MVQIFPYSGDEELEKRANAAVPIVAHAANEPTVHQLHPEFRRPYEKLMNAWDLIPLALKELFSQAYRAWVREQDRQVYPNPHQKAAAVTACTYAIAIVSIVGPIGDMQLLRLMQEQAAVEEELRRRTTGR